MNAKSEKLLLDVISSARFIQEHMNGETYESYQTNQLLRLAIERQFEIIGEACRRLAITDPATAAGISELEKIIALRNVIAHGYDAIIDERLLKISETSIPTLIAEVVALIGASDSTTAK
jgi:uncharacterized protein with HEPN domain